METPPGEVGRVLERIMARIKTHLLADDDGRLR
jgi:hypothetical protein